MRWLTAIPAYNEARHLPGVLRAVRPHAPELLVVDDGSSDGTAAVLAAEPGLHVVRHPANRGYGAAIASAFEYALAHGYDALVTIDSDGQHDPARLADMVAALADADIASGSRYLDVFDSDTAAPGDRRRINRLITADLNDRYGFGLTDAFCGFKAYRREALACFRVTENGWGMPLQVWAQAARAGLRVVEVAVPRIYLDLSRQFGGVLNDEEARLAYYRRVLDDADAAPAGAALACGARGGAP